ncbi:MAG: acetyl-CoA carboxylase carboxyltransferase subunit alpha [Elusimicrobia bacterium]|nr:acetyl-CoA carboxylase carboxyltransferase subunit alpha [Elusimicrobiota bacterium]
MAEHTTTFKGFDFEKPILDLEEQIQGLEKTAQDNEGVGITAEIKALRQRLDDLRRDIYGKLTPWQRVQIARHPRRPYSLDFIERVFTGFIEMHGDRHFADDKAIVGGPAYLDGKPVVVIGHQKGRTLQESMARNFGMPHPEGYRKALRLMRMAAKFGAPIIAFIDTAGAYPGIGAEERGQATAIAENLREMSQFAVPILCCVIGEGGSGGALALGVGDRILMLENSWYSVISPEGCASILYHDAAKAPEAARALKITAADLKEMGVIDEILPEPLGGAHRDVDASAVTVKEALLRNLMELQAMPPVELVKKRYDKFRSIGRFETTEKARLSARRKTKVKSKE